ncbi:uncharacterized protein RJT20DRAFT_35501 [Scheffersomyces xylosifermentans]|uniref:uncharacterized protein n=1 Tax=Scheffersomyces xylosifermentans TaxID=1304137 RepID=UPI00315DE49E
MAEEAKLTKKQRKALEFRSDKSKEEREEEKKEKKDKKRAREEADKKRKTRRGKKGKGVNGGKGPRFLLFVGNLPYDITEPELLAHFKNSNPDRIRIRQDKGIAFLEFDNDTQEIQSKMELALKMHHSLIRSRKINVELTVGGGGNSENRVNKLKEKNEKLLEERRKAITERNNKKAKEVREKAGNVPSTSSGPGIHPSRAALMN